jgi:hypothetical protein
VIDFGWGTRNQVQKYDHALRPCCLLPEHLKRASETYLALRPTPPCNVRSASTCSSRAGYTVELLTSPIP